MVNDHPYPSLPLSAVPPSSDPSPNPTDRDVILVVDDEPGIRQLLFDILQDAGYTVVIVASGVAALEVLTTAAVDLVLLDIVMPGLDGVATLRALRTHSNVPVIILSASITPANLETLQQLEIAAYVTKPFDLQRLLDTIQLLLQ